MERHYTHLLSCSSSMEHSYKYDKEGNIVLDSLSSVPFIQNIKNKKIKTSELFNDIKNKDSNIIQEEENLINNNENEKNNTELKGCNGKSFSKKIKDDNNIKDNKKEEDNNNNNNSYHENKTENDKKNEIINGDKTNIYKDKSKKLISNNNYQIISLHQDIIYIPQEKECRKETTNIENNEKYYLRKNESNNINKIIIKKEADFNFMVKKYDNKDLQEINIESIFLQSIKPQKININKIKNHDKSNNSEDKKVKYEYTAKFTERMKFSSKTNSFLSPINDIIKEKDIFIKHIDHIIKLPINFNNYCYMIKSPLIIKYKTNNKNVVNKLCFYTKEVINYGSNKNKNTAESLMFDEFNNKLNLKEEKIIKNKYKVSDILDKKSILNKTNENEYNQDFQNSIKEDNNENDEVNIKDDKNGLLKNNIIINKIEKDKGNQNYINEIGKENNLDMNNKNNTKDNKNNEYKNFNDNNLFEDDNNIDKNNLSNNKYNNSNYINNGNNKEMSQILKQNKNLLFSPKATAIYTNHNNIKPLNIFSSKKPRLPSSVYRTHFKQNKDITDDKTKTFSKINPMNTPSSLVQKNIQRNKLFNNESNFSKINSKRTSENEKQNRNKSLVNIINHNKHHNINFDIEEDKNHYHNEINIFKGKKYERHFGKEENCPICVALQMRNKFLEEKNTLPLLKVKNIHNERTNTQSPNKRGLNSGMIKKNIEKMSRIMSSKPDYVRKRGIRRNGSAQEITTNLKEIISQQNKEENINFNKKIVDERFPCLNEYFNNNKNN